MYKNNTVMTAFIKHLAQKSLNFSPDEKKTIQPKKITKYKNSCFKGKVRGS